MAAPEGESEVGSGTEMSQVLEKRVCGHNALVRAIRSADSAAQAAAALAAAARAAASRVSAAQAAAAQAAIAEAAAAQAAVAHATAAKVAAEQTRAAQALAARSVAAQVAVSRAAAAQAAAAQAAAAQAAAAQAAVSRVADAQAAAGFASGGAPAAAAEDAQTMGGAGDVAMFPYKAKVGDYVDVYWPLENMFYVGRVTRFYANSGHYCVEYLDGDHELVDLNREIWYHSKPLLTLPASVAGKAPGTG